MSHSVNIKTQFKNIQNLLGQFTQAGWAIEQNTKCRTYPSDPRRDEVHTYVAKNPKNTGYDIGIDIDSEGNAYFVCDFFDSSIEKQLGQNLQNIKQGYTLTEIQRQLDAENFAYSVEELATGEKVLTAYRN
jgi:hypothetical protein